MRTLRFALLLAALPLAVAGPAAAATFLWNNSAGGGWDSPPNWGSTTYPRYFFDFAIFPVPGTYEVVATDPSRVLPIAGIDVEGSDVALLCHDGFAATVTVAMSGMPSTLRLRRGVVTGAGAHGIASGGTLVLEPGTRLVGPASGSVGLNLEAGATLRGDGGGFDRGILRAAGTLSPGLAPGAAGSLVLGGTDPADLEFAPTGVLEIEIGGSLPGAQYDQLRVERSTVPVRLDGALRVSFLPGYAPADGDRFDVLVAPSLAGAFATVELPAVPGFHVDLVQELERVSVLVTAEAPALAIVFDVKPGSTENPLNVRSRGVLPAALAGGPIDPATVDIASIRLEGVAPIRSGREDVTAPTLDDGGCASGSPDGIVDLTLAWDTQAIVAALGDVADGEVRSLTLTGSRVDGTAFEASDCVRLQVPGADRGRGKKNAAPEVTTGPALRVDAPAEARSQRILATAGTAGPARLLVFDIRGRLVATPWAGDLGDGESEIAWDASSLASGMYFYRLDTAAGVAVLRFRILR